jgi:allophanate hydrolase subunit 1
MDLNLTQTNHHKLAEQPTHANNSYLIYDRYYYVLQSYNRKLEGIWSTGKFKQFISGEQVEININSYGRYAHDLIAILLHNARNDNMSNISKIHIHSIYMYQVISNLLKLINSKLFKNYTDFLKLPF